MESFEGLLGRTEELLARLEEFDEGDREDVFELLDAIDELHRRGLETIAAVLEPDQIQVLTARPAAAWLLEAYGLAPAPEAVPVQITPRPPRRPT